MKKFLSIVAWPVINWLKSVFVCPLSLVSYGCNFGTFLTLCIIMPFDIFSLSFLPYIFIENSRMRLQSIFVRLLCGCRWFCSFHKIHLATFQWFSTFAGSAVLRCASNILIKLIFCFSFLISSEKIWHVERNTAVYTRKSINFSWYFNVTHRIIYVFFLFVWLIFIYLSIWRLTLLLVLCARVVAI